MSPDFFYCPLCHEILTPMPERVVMDESLTYYYYCMACYTAVTITGDGRCMFAGPETKGQVWRGTLADVAKKV